ncbi:MAG: L,D-transpeptidase [Bacteroidetes bacterium]|nr:L,D-transpeptidase [Bacteroidota bacterium]
MKSNKYLIGTAFLLLALASAFILFWNRPLENRNQIPTYVEPVSVRTDSTAPFEKPAFSIPITQPVTIERYFSFMDALVRQYDTLVPYALTEHMLVRANPWIIDSLENTDYYRQIARGNFVADQRKMTILQTGDTLILPGPKAANLLQSSIQATSLDINLPAFRLRIMEKDSVLYDFPVRIGKNQKKYLALAGGNVDLRTHTGTGEIIRINRRPVFFDPVTGKQFTHTKRDDQRTTWMPLIPWIEPAIDGNRYGQMIHPTTNPRTLGKPASNGCIGLKEADAWRVYYYAPIGTKVVIRYDLFEESNTGDTLRYKDVYPPRVSRKKVVGKSVVALYSGDNQDCWCGH